MTQTALIMACADAYRYCGTSADRIMRSKEALLAAVEAMAAELERLHKVVVIKDNMVEDLHKELEAAKLHIKHIGNDALRTENHELRQELEAAKEQYNDLLYCVGKKYPGESRHDTAKRYLIDREKFGIGDAGAAQKEQQE